MQSGINNFAPAPPVEFSQARRNFSAAERRFSRFGLGIFLAQVFLCALPSAGILALKHTALAGHVFWATLGLNLLVLATLGRRDEILCLILAVGPFINLLRGFAFYNVIIAVFGAGLLFYFVLTSETVRDNLKKFPLLWALAVAVTIFYLISFFNTRQYFVNLRLYELVLTLIYVLILGRNQALLGAALLGMIVSACAVGWAMVPQMGAGTRLGLIEVGKEMLGNPTQLGIPLAFGFLALIADRGRWLNLQSATIWKLLLLVLILPLLALTTSRASWLVAAGGIVLCIFFGSKQRIKMLFVVALCIGAFQIILHSPYRSSLENGLKRTFGDERSARQRTSGRSDQWKVSSYAFNKSIESRIRGYGPGMGPEIYAQYSGLVDGVKYGVGKKAALHSLFMQIGVETGLIGLLLLAIWLGICLCKIFQKSFSAGLLFPLVCFFGYVFIVVTVSGGDINSGVFLGIALLGTVKSKASSLDIKSTAETKGNQFQDTRKLNGNFAYEYTNGHRGMGVAPRRSRE